MVMSKIVVTVCDVCGDKDKPTTPYRITSEGRKVTADLCADHRGPLDALLAPAGPRRRRTSMGAHVTTVDEIEKSKATKKTAAKRTAAKK